jgi:hypothetical protein
MEFSMLFSDYGSVHFESDFNGGLRPETRHDQSAVAGVNERLLRELTSIKKEGWGDLAKSDLAGKSLISGADCNKERRKGLSRQKSRTLRSIAVYAGKWKYAARYCKYEWDLLHGLV